ncbi:hypothetical protein ACFY7H_14330 [Streptomyces sp. NPDC012794]|uniref:hypothetical protein n=1 Tax=Streptomyces sp. NPDC012794 TaxID=3364850 RepID=UPI00369F20E6
MDGPGPQDAPDENPADRPPRPPGPTDGGSNPPWGLALLALATTLLSALMGPLLQLLGIHSSPVASGLVLFAVLVGGIVAVRKAFKERPAMSRRARRLSVAGLAVFLLACTALVVVFRPRPPPADLARLPGTQGVAVVGFAGVGPGHDQRVLDDVSEAFTATLLEGRLPEGGTARDYARITSPPLEVLAGTGRDRRKLDDWTAGFVDETNAGIVVGGLVSADAAGQIGLRPAVYVRAAQVLDAPELAGWYLSGPIRLDQDWNSDTGRRHVIAELARRTRGLAGFTHALDLWRAGRVADARRELDRLLAPAADGTRDDGSEFVTADLVRLFRGHALEQIAVGLPAAGRAPYFEAARADYRAIAPDGPIALRARLSLAGARYQLALGPKPGCLPGTVDAEALAAASAELRALAADDAFTETGRLRASVNLAQVELCRVTARLVRDDGTIERAVTRVRSAQGGGAAVEELRVLATSIAAVHAYGRGDLAGAVATMKEAVAKERGFARRGLWQALAAGWEFRGGDLAAGCADLREALGQLRDARAKGEITAQRYEEIEDALRQQATAAKAPCAGAPQDVPPSKGP